MSYQSSFECEPVSVAHKYSGLCCPYCNNGFAKDGSKSNRWKSKPKHKAKAKTLRTHREGK